MITHVTVLEDRAQVRRTLSTKLAAGFQRLHIDGTSALIHDRSLTAKVHSGRCRVVDVRCVRRWLVGVSESAGDAKALLEAEAALGQERAEWQRRRDGLQGEREQLQQALELGVQGVQTELPFASALPDALTQTLPQLLERQRQVELDVWQAERALTACADKAEALLLRRELLQRPEQTLSATIEIDVDAEAAGDVSLYVEYMVPCAAWRPMHRAKLDGARIVFETDAAVWQATGEAWDDVQLQFSTARSTQRAEPPLLQDDVIAVRDKQSKQVIAHVREQRIQTTGEGMAEPDVPGVDDGGETRLLGAARKASIVADGRLHRVPVSSFSADCSAERTARPELSPLVHLLSRQKNTSPQPILAGPVELVRGSGVVGTATTAFVAPGETFMLGWGGDDSLRVKRAASETRDTARLTGKLKIERSIIVYLSNLAPAPVEFQVEERIAVSELAQVEVALDDEKTKPLKTADDNGIVRWQVRLPAHGTDTIALHYSLQASSDVSGL